MKRLIEARGLRYRYPDGTQALDGVDFHLDAGECIAVFGANGSGKTTFVPINFADRVTGIHLANATLAALLHRARTGEGQEVEVPMFETMAEMVLSEHLWSDYFVPPRKVKNRNRMFDRRPYKTKDGYICVMASGEKMFSAFCDIIDRPELKTDPRFAHRSQRTNHLPEVYEITEAALATRTSAEWLQLLEQADIPASPVHNMESLLADPHLNDVDFFQIEEHPTEGKVVGIRNPITFDGERGALGPWILTIARNRAIDYLRTAENRKDLNAAGTDRLESLGLFHALDHAHLSPDCAKRVRKAFASLSEKQKLALSMAFFEGTPQTEIAEKLRQPLETVKEWTVDALDKIGRAHV